MKQTFLKLIKHTGIYSISEIASRAVGFLLIPLYTRYLTPSDYGVLEVLFVTQAIMVIIGNQGLGSALFKFWSDTPDHKQKALASSCLWYELVSATTVAAVGIYFSDGISRLLLGTPKHGDLFKWISISLVFNLAQLILRQILRARLESVKVCAISLLKLIIAVSLNIYLIVFMQMGLVSIVVSDVISSAVAALAGFWFVRSFVRFHFNFREISPVIAFGLPMIGGGLSNWVLSVSDRYFLAHYSTEAELGLYSLAYKFSAVLSMVMLQPFLTTWPSIYFDAAKQPNAAEFFSRVARYFSLIFCVAGTGLVLASNIAIRVMSPPEFWPSTSVVYLLAGSVVLEGLFSIFVAVLYLEHGAKIPAVFIGTAAVFNILLNLLLIPDLGMKGAAIATLLSYLLMVLLTYHIAQRKYPVQYAWKSISASLAVFLAVGAIATAIPTQGLLLDMVIALIVLICTAAAAFLSPMLTRSEREAFGSALHILRTEGLSVAIKKLSMG